MVSARVGGSHVATASYKYFKLFHFDHSVSSGFVTDGFNQGSMKIFGELGFPVERTWMHHKFRDS